MLYARNPARWKWPLVAVAFALPWVRLEYVAISLAATGALCLIEWARRGVPSPQPSPLMGEGAGLGTPEVGEGRLFLLPLWEKVRMRGNAIVPLLGAVAGILAYFAYNGLIFGGITPPSRLGRRLDGGGKAVTVSSRTSKTYCRITLTDADVAAWFWERMGPHFDYQSDGVGMIVDGRMAQVFTRDCEPDDLIAWSWTGQGDETAIKLLDTDLHQNQSELCVAATVLPRDALPPVRIETMTASQYLADLVRDSEPAIRADFDMHLIETRLIYVKEPCRPEDVEARFFLHLDPADANDLPEHRKRHGFDNLDFRLDRQEFRYGGLCVATRTLPEYNIAKIRTSQYIPGEGRLWEGKFRFEEP